MKVLGFYVSTGQCRFTVLEGDRDDPTLLAKGRLITPGHGDVPKLMDWYDSQFRQLITTHGPDKMAYRLTLEPNKDQLFCSEFPLGILNLIAHQQSLPIANYTARSFTATRLGLDKSVDLYAHCDDVFGSHPPPPTLGHQSEAFTAGSLVRARRMTHPSDVDKYQIIRSLGSGHFGQVYHAFDRALRAEKAIKILKAKDPNDFLTHLKEAQILRRCTHKHIVPINEANIFDVQGEQRVVLDLEYVQGGSLESALRDRWVSVREAVTYIHGALLGLEHAHSQGFLHRDIKPGNILLAPAGAKLSDFGLATEPGTSLYGSPRGYITHLPPEYFTSPATSVLTDVYATGVTLFRAVSNIADWRAVSKEVPDYRKHVEAGTLIREIGYDGFVPAPLRRIISKACAAHPAKRFQSAHDFGQQLDKLRFNIDWILTDESKWRGFSDVGKHDASVSDQTNTLTITRNGRRVAPNCKTFPTSSAAIAALHSHVAKTTFA